LKSALNAMGDFSRMTTFERQYVKKLVPFYPWLRHQTEAMLRLPIEHPARAIWMAHLATLYADDNERRGIEEGFGANVGGMNIGSLLPFPETVPLTSPTELLGALTPGLSAPLALTTGLNLRAQGGPSQFARPRGEPRSGGLYKRPAEAGYYAAGLTPISRLLRDVTGYGVGPGGGPELNQGVARYSAGYEFDDPEERRKSWLRQLAEFAGLPAQAG
jgi:hypothetical protein